MKGRITFGQKRVESTGLAVKNSMTHIFMIRYSKTCQLTHAEIKGQTSLIIHSVGPCMFSCFKCFNQSILSNTFPFQTIEEVITSIKKMYGLIDNIIISGGEFLLNELDQMIIDLRKIKDVSSAKIILYTTGLHHEKLKNLFQMCLVDAIHMDFKLPYPYLSDEEDEALMHLALGCVLSQKTIMQLVASLHFVVKYDKGDNTIRSVRYPFLSDAAFNVMKHYVQELNILYHKNVPYHINPFYDVPNK